MLFNNYEVKKKKLLLGLFFLNFTLHCISSQGSEEYDKFISQGNKPIVLSSKIHIGKKTWKKLSIYSPSIKIGGIKIFTVTAKKGDNKKIETDSQDESISYLDSKTLPEKSIVHIGNKGCYASYFGFFSLAYNYTSDENYCNAEILSY